MADKISFHTSPKGEHRNPLLHSGGPAAPLKKDIINSQPSLGQCPWRSSALAVDAAQTPASGSRLIGFVENIDTLGPSPLWQQLRV